VTEAAERVVYVDGRITAPRVVGARQSVLSSTAIISVDTSTSVRNGVPSSDQSLASSTPLSIVLPSGPAVAAAPTTPSVVGAPTDGLTVGFSTHPHGQIRYDSALGAVQDKLAATIAVAGDRPVLSQAERDEQMRTEARDAVAARGAGAPQVLGMTAGGGIAVPLPFGGPSNAQRKRDRQAYEETKLMMARLQRRVDSVVATRRRRFADSLAQVADSQVRHARPR
jgi:hypothetical protein